MIRSEPAPTSAVPFKHFYTIGDVSRLTAIKPHVLRYWETQFGLLRPARRYSGHRKYSQREIDLINRIRYLVVDRKFTLAGAKREINRQLNPRFKAPSLLLPAKADGAMDLLRDAKKEVEDCLQILQP
ncbi:MAG: MerR family transcriptional regulator [Elusimicrobia bacterium]|nr:MerR family transcriptional regulator [Candidatus Obscuribacterium magneticum]